MYEITIICLANSRKPPSGRCIAGKKYEGEHHGEWIRPVSSRPGREVSEEERRYENGSKAQLLDIVTVPLEEHSPFGHQVENHILADDYYWNKHGTATWNEVCDIVDHYDDNFWMNAESTRYGLNDKISENEVGDINSSLKLIVVSQLEVVVRVEEGFDGRPGRRRVRARFEYKNEQYLLSVTDPVVEQQHLSQGVGSYEIENAALCISLAEVWHGYAFRLVASVITPARCKV